jgi:hypothetical protein
MTIYQLIKQQAKQAPGNLAVALVRCIEDNQRENHRSVE